MSEAKQNERLVRLQSELAKIGYHLRHCGCNHYRVMNYLNEPTMIEFFGDSMTTHGKDIFGRVASQHGDAGRIYFEIDKCEIGFDAMVNCVTISTGGACITFHNFRA